MSMRSTGREAALQYLYSEQSGAENPLDHTFWKLRPAAGAVKKFAEELTRGVQKHRETLDSTLCEFVENYSLERIALVDRCILEIALFEIFHCPQTPPIVAINEAIELAKRFGSEHSGRFVNGILDQIARRYVTGDPHRPQKNTRPDNT